MPFKARLDGIVVFILREREKVAAAEGKEGERPFHKRHHQLRLFEDERATVRDDEEEDHWVEGDAHVVRPAPQRPSAKAKSGANPQKHGHPHDDSASPHTPCAVCGTKYKNEVMQAMINRLAALEMEDAQASPDVRYAWALAISAVERDDPAATRAIDRAHEAGVAPKNAVDSVAKAVVGAEHVDAKPKIKKGKKKSVTCACM